MSLDQSIRAVQNKVGATVDGKPGPDTWKALTNFLSVDSGALNSPPLDKRSETNIATLLPDVQPYARALVEKARSVGIEIRVISGTRTFEEQDRLYAQGRTSPEKIVSNAKGGESNHNFGLAFDVGVFEDGAYQAESPSYKAVGALGLQLGLSWGGNWKTIHDEPHFELRPLWAKDMSESAILAALRERKANGISAFA
jgi:peptidoglycan L-alanyl-D-glutamate endopeptidase CwlK